MAAPQQLRLQSNPAKKPRACIPCHIRKVRCDAANVGIPCTRCVNRDKRASCALVDVPEPGHRVKRRRADFDASQLSFNTPENFASAVATLSSALAEETDAVEVTRSSISTHAPRNVPVPDATTQAPQRESIRLQDRNEVQPSVEQPNLDSRDQVVQEDEAQLQLCREMSQWGSAYLSRSRTGIPNEGREVIEFHEGIDASTILSEIFGRRPPKYLVRVVVKEAHPAIGSSPRNLRHLPDDDMEYLHKKDAMSLPPRQACNKLLRLFFDCIYPYVPVFDRIPFMCEYEDGSHSIFLLQSLLASTIPYASSELLREAGFENHLNAQKSVLEKARLLYDIGAETNQIRLLQGSIILSLLQYSFAVDKDYRYWLSNAFRLAVHMGLHRNIITRDLDATTAKLFRRLWWVLYNRDSLLASFGFTNASMFHDTFYDTTELVESDWEEEIIPERFRSILPSVTKLQKQYMIESCRLSHISVPFVQSFRTPRVTPSNSAFEEMEDSLLSWCRSLPQELHCDPVHEWTVDNVWMLVLMTRYHLLQCIFYRLMSQRSVQHHGVVCMATQRLNRSMFELDTIIDRVVLHDLARFCPLFLMNSAATLLAMRIETAINQSTSYHERVVARAHIHNELRFLRSQCARWNSVNWTVRMLEFIVARTNLTIQDDGSFDVGIDSPFNVNSDTSNHGNDQRTTISLGSQDIPEAFNDLARWQDTVGTLTGSEGWLQELLGLNVSTREDTLLTV